MSKEAEVNIKESATVKFKNDLARISFQVESKLSDSPNKSYESVIPVVNSMNRLLESEDSILNKIINYEVQTEYDYDPKKLLGFKTIANVRFYFPLKSNGSIEKLASLQDRLMGFSSNSARVFLDSTNFTLSEKQRKEFESQAIKKAVLYAKRKAQLVTETTFGTNYYQVKSMDVNISDNYYPIPRSKASASLMSSEASSGSALSPGTSSVTANVQIKIGITV